jgi:hypothetical protein
MRAPIAKGNRGQLQDDDIGDGCTVLDRRRTLERKVHRALDRSGPERGAAGVTPEGSETGCRRLDLRALRPVKILGIFSDWPATVTYYDNCMGLK